MQVLVLARRLPPRCATPAFVSRACQHFLTAAPAVASLPTLTLAICLTGVVSDGCGGGGCVARRGAEGCLGPILLQRGGDAAAGANLEPMDDIVHAVAAWWAGVQNATGELLSHLHLPIPLSGGGGGGLGSAHDAHTANASSVDGKDQGTGEAGAGGGKAQSGCLPLPLPAPSSCLPSLAFLWGGRGGSEEKAQQADVFEGDGAGTEPEELTDEAINDDLVNKILRICDKAEWTQISNDDGIRVWRTSLPPDLAVGGQPLGKTSQFYAIMAQGILDAPPAQVHKYFIDNSRVHEYNEYCKEIKDLEQIDANTKITWSASGKVGPFKERDFVTRVHYRTLPDGTLVIANRRQESELAPSSERYLRMEIMVGGNIIRCVEGDASKTHFTVLTHVNPGGVAETRLGAMILNSAAASGPLKFIHGLRKVPLSHPRAHHSCTLAL